MTDFFDEFRRFVLVREVDVSGVSGTGVVAEGVEFSDGTVALRWTSANPTSVVFHDNGIKSVEAVHGHGGNTKIEWLDRTAETTEALEIRHRNERENNVVRTIADSLGISVDELRARVNGHFNPTN